MANAKTTAKKTVHATTRVAKKGPAHKKAVAKKTSAKDMEKLKAAVRESVKKAAAKKKPASKKAAKSAPAKAKKVKRAVLDLKPIKTKMNRGQLVTYLAEHTEVGKREVKAVLETLVETMKACMMPKGCGTFQIPGVLVVKTKKIAATKGGKKVVSFGVERVTKAKAATVKVRSRALGALKRAALGTE